MLVRTHLLIATGLLGVALCSSCGSSPRPNPAAGISRSLAAEMARSAQLRPVLVQCFAAKGIIPASAFKNAHFYKNGHVTADDDFARWWRDYEGLPVMVQGRRRQLDEVLKDAVDDGKWPMAVCGPMPSVSPALPKG